MFTSSKHTEKIYQGKEFLSRNLGKVRDAASKENEWSEKESGELTIGQFSSFGDQVLSQKSSNPKVRISNRNEKDTDLSKNDLPGPGLYQTHSAIGKQNQSKIANLPSWTFCHSGRWSHYASTFNQHFETPPSLLYT